MIEWKKVYIGKAIKFNPRETLPKGKLARKIPMANLTEFQRQLNGFEFSEYKSGPKFRNADTLLSKITPCLENGKTAQVDILDANEVAFGSSEFIVLRATRYTDPDFVYYLSISPTFRKRAISCMEGTSGRKRVNENTLKFFELPFPGIDEQKRIATLLKRIDNKIEVNNKINQELEAMAKTLYDYWFVQFDFPTSARYAATVGKPDLEGKPYKSSGGKMVYNEELKREIPEGWEDRCFGDYGTVSSGYAFKSSSWADSGFPVVKIKDITEDGEIDLSNLAFVAEADTKKARRFKAGPGDLVIAMTGATIGKFAIIPYTDKEIYINQRVGLYELGANPLEKLPFIYCSLRQEYFREQVFLIASGAAQPNISGEQLDDIQLILPPKDLVEKFNKDYSPVFRKILLNQNENQKLAELRDWLLPMLMNGQVRVGNKKNDEEINLNSAAEAPLFYGIESSLSNLSE